MAPLRALTLRSTLPRADALRHGALACALSIALHAIALFALMHSWSPAPRLDVPSLRIELSLAAPLEPAAEIRPPPPMPRARREPARPDAIARAPVAPKPVPASQTPAPETAARVVATTAVAAASVVLPEVAQDARDVANVDRASVHEASRDAGAASQHAVVDATGVVADPSQEQRVALEWRVQQWLAQFRKYPRAAARAGYQGTVMVRFVLDRDGALLLSELIDSSGHALLDRAALELLDRAAPFPPLPRGTGLDEIELVLPIDYRLAGVSG